MKHLIEKTDYLLEGYCIEGADRAATHIVLFHRPKVDRFGIIYVRGEYGVAEYAVDGTEGMRTLVSALKSGVIYPVADHTFSLIVGRLLREGELVQWFRGQIMFRTNDGQDIYNLFFTYYPESEIADA